MILWVRKGMRNKEIAALLKLREVTVKAYMRRIFMKMDVSTRAELVGLIDDLRE